MSYHQNHLDEFSNALMHTPTRIIKRFLNFLIDIMGIGLFLAIILNMLGIFSGSAAQTATQEPGMLPSYLFSFSITILYYGLLEGFTRGKTLGKFITGTRAVKNNGEPLEWQHVIMRSLLRLIPFEFLSIFWGKVWHDKYSKTMVIND